MGSASAGASSAGSFAAERKVMREVGTSGKILKFESYTYDMVARCTDDSAEYAPGSNLVRFSGEGVLPSDIETMISAY